MRWLNKITELVENVKKENKVKNNIPLGEKYKLETVKNETIKTVTDYFEMQSFHTAIASLMKYFNNLVDLKKYYNTVEFIDALKIFFQLLYPLAPHISLEMYNQLKDPSDKEEVDEIVYLVFI